MNRLDERIQLPASELLHLFIREAARCPVRIPAEAPWRVLGQAEADLREALKVLPSSFELVGPDVAVHRSAAVADSAVLTGPVIVSAGCRIGPGAIVRSGVWADEDVVIGPHSEVKNSLVFARTAIAHRNYVGDSIIGQDVNLEAGAVLANHYNERTDKQISVLVAGQVMPTGLPKFGALLGDGTRIGANAVTSPGTLLPPGSVVPRLGLVEQLPPTAPDAAQ